MSLVKSCFVLSCTLFSCLVYDINDRYWLDDCRWVYEGFWLLLKLNRMISYQATHVTLIDKPEIPSHNCPEIPCLCDTKFGSIYMVNTKWPQKFEFHTKRIRSYHVLSPFLLFYLEQEIECFILCIINEWYAHPYMLLLTIRLNLFDVL